MTAMHDDDVIDSSMSDVELAAWAVRHWPAVQRRMEADHEAREAVLRFALAVAISAPAMGSA